MLSRTCRPLTHRPVYGSQAIQLRTAFNSFGASKQRPNLPTAPHVSIYRFPLPAITSILHRITGTSLAVGFTLVGAGVIINPAFASGLVATIKLSPFLHFVTKLAVGYAGVYHVTQGLRHLYWDTTSKGLDNIPQMDASSRLVFVSSILVALALALIF